MIDSWQFIDCWGHENRPWKIWEISSWWSRWSRADLNQHRLQQCALPSVVAQRGAAGRASMIDSHRLAYKLWTLGSKTTDWAAAAATVHLYVSQGTTSTQLTHDGFEIYSFSTTSRNFLQQVSLSGSVSNQVSFRPDNMWRRSVAAKLHGNSKSRPEKRAPN